MEAKAARPIKAEKHLWYKYTGKKPFVIKDTKGQTLTLKNGDLFGLFNLNNRVDRVVVPSRPDIRYFLKVEDGGELLDSSRRHRDPVEFSAVEKPAKPPKPIKVVIKEPAAPKRPTKLDVKLERLDKIRKAAKPSSVKSPSRQDKAQLLKPKKKREEFDLDEDTFRDDDDGLDFRDFHH